MHRILTRALPLALFALILLPAPASAGAILITRGDSFSKIADIKDPEIRQKIRQATGKDMAVGFKYSYFGVFWIDFWTWGGEYCVFEDKNYSPLTPADAA